MNNLHRYARARADLYKYAFMDRAKAALLGKKKDTTQPFNGIRFTSHPSGTYDLNNHLAAQAEHAAVKHAVHTAGLVPKRQATEDSREYDQNVNKLTHAFVNHIRQHVHSNPNDQLTNYYLRTADKMKVPDDPSLPKTPGQPLEYHAPLPVGVRDLSTAVMPLVRKTAEDLNLRPKSTVLLPEEPSHLPKAGDELDLDGGGDENNYIDLLDPQFEEEHPEATENRVATELHNIQDVGKRRLGEFGSGKPAYEVVNDPGEQDFNFEMPQVEGLEGPTPEIQEIESHRPPKPRAKPNVIPAPKRQEMYQAIADTMKNSPIGGLSERVVKMLKEAYGLSARQANSMFESYKKVGMGNKGQKPTGRKTVPEDKYGLSRRGPSPRKFGAREVEYNSEAAKFGSHLVSQAMGEDQTSLIPLVDHLYEHEHPAAELIQRIQQGHPEYMGNAFRAGLMGTPAREGSSRIPMHRLFVGTRNPIRLGYIHLPDNRNYINVSLEHVPPEGEPADGYRSREYMLPVTSDYVAKYVNHLNENHNGEAAREWHRALTREPHPDQHDEQEDTHLREQEQHLSGPSQLSRLARVRYAKRKRKPKPQHPYPEDIVASQVQHNEWPVMGAHAGDDPLQLADLSEEEVHNFADAHRRVPNAGLPGSAGRFRRDDPVTIIGGPHEGKRGSIAGLTATSAFTVLTDNNGKHAGITHIPFEHLQLNEEEPHQYAAYRAPAGGMAVRGTFYKGGSLIPDMEGSFMKPKSKLNPAKLAALKTRMRMSNSKI